MKIVMKLLVAGMSTVTMFFLGTWFVQPRTVSVMAQDFFDGIYMILRCLFLFAQNFRDFYQNVL